MTSTSSVLGLRGTVTTAGRLYDAVLFDRDGTLVHDVPYNGDPAMVRPVDGAREALDRLRRAGLRLYGWPARIRRFRQGRRADEGADGKARSRTA